MDQPKIPTLKDSQKPQVKVRGLGAGITFLDRMKQFNKKDLAFILAGLGTLFMAPLAEHFMMSPDNGDASLSPGFGSGKGAGPGIFGAEDRTSDGSGTAVGSPVGGSDVITPLNVRDPSSLIMGPGSSSQPPTNSSASVAPPVSGSGRSDQDVRDALAGAASHAASAAVKKSLLPVPKISLSGSSLRGLGVASGTSSATAGPGVSTQGLGLGSHGNVANNMAGVKGGGNIASVGPRGQTTGADAQTALKAAADKAGGMFDRAAGSAQGNLNAAANESIPGGGGQSAGGGSGPGGGGPADKPGNGGGPKDSKSGGESLAYEMMKQNLQKQLELYWKEQEAGDRTLEMYKLENTAMESIAGTFASTIGTGLGNVVGCSIPMFSKYNMTCIGAGMNNLTCAGAGGTAGFPVQNWGGTSLGWNTCAPSGTNTSQTAGQPATTSGGVSPVWMVCKTLADGTSILAACSNGSGQQLIKNGPYSAGCDQGYGYAICSGSAGSGNGNATSTPQSGVDQIGGQITSDCRAAGGLAGGTLDIKTTQPYLQQIAADLNLLAQGKNELDGSSMPNFPATNGLSCSAASVHGGANVKSMLQDVFGHINSAVNPLLASPGVANLTADKVQTLLPTALKEYNAATAELGVMPNPAQTSAQGYLQEVTTMLGHVKPVTGSGVDSQYTKLAAEVDPGNSSGLPKQVTTVQTTLQTSANQLQSVLTQLSDAVNADSTGGQDSNDPFSKNTDPTILKVGNANTYAANLQTAISDYNEKNKGSPLPVIDPSKPVPAAQVSFPVVASGQNAAQLASQVDTDKLAVTKLINQACQNIGYDCSQSKASPINNPSQQPAPTKFNDTAAKDLMKAISDMRSAQLGVLNAVQGAAVKAKP
ncbi:MAG: hypothetical protein HKL90_05905 [Elusimicrobia bacterium]|nr:hypothetical protein [Elusimicrobiota bacterium]